MNTTAQKSPHELAKEKERLWGYHIQNQRDGSLSRREYCHEHKLNYGQFGYWSQKWPQQPSSSQLIPVNINGLISDGTCQGTVCTLVKNGYELKVHDKAIVPILLSLLD